jgi:DNA-binding LytR/AlgR family response regulator
VTAQEKFRVLIVDDEPLAQQRLADLLRHQDGVEIVGTADNGDAAVEAIRDWKPDLVFLDVQMPGKTGLDVVREIGPEAMPATIFVTAYDQYALKAFELAVVDYLVKPFDDERFEQAFRRARLLESDGRSAGVAPGLRPASRGATNPWRLEAVRAPDEVPGAPGACASAPRRRSSP